MDSTIKIELRNALNKQAELNKQATLNGVLGNVAKTTSLSKRANLMDTEIKKLINKLNISC